MEISSVRERDPNPDNAAGFFLRVTDNNAKIGAWPADVPAIKAR